MASTTSESRLMETTTKSNWLLRRAHTSVRACAGPLLRRASDLTELLS